MPNKRKAGLEPLSLWVDSDVKKELRLIAKMRGVSVSAVLFEIIAKEIAVRKK